MFQDRNSYQQHNKYSSGSQPSASIFQTLFTFKDISDKTQAHLTKVYTTLMVCTLICATGMYINSAFFLSGFIMNILSVILSVYMMYQVMNKANSEDSRLLYLGGLAFQMGFLVGPAIHHIADLHPEILMQAVLYTAAAFISFSLVSLLSKRRSYLFLGSIIATIFQGMILYRTFNWLFGSS